MSQAHDFYYGHVTRISQCNSCRLLKIYSMMIISKKAILINLLTIITVLLQQLAIVLNIISQLLIILMSEFTLVINDNTLA